MTKQARSTNTVPAEQAAGHCDNPGQPDTGPNSKQQQRQQQQHRQQQRQQHNGFHKQPAPDAQQQQQQLATAVSPTSKRKAPAAAGATHKSKHKKHQHQSVTQQPGRDINNEPEQPGQAPIAAAVAAASTVPGAAAAGTAAAVAVSDPKDDEVRRLFRSWAWKREHRPDKDRFHRPYVHTMLLPSSSSGSPHQVSLTIKQQKFSSEGFASTVWDSSIVAAKYLEKLGPIVLSGKRCLDLSAGCGLVGVVMAKLGADVTVTVLAPNLPLLQHNCNANGFGSGRTCGADAVLQHRWGEDVTPLHPPFSFIVACDVMYVHELVQPLVQSLTALSNPSTTILVAHGRNRPAEPDFRALASKDFTVELVPGCELDEVYQCSNGDVLRLRRRYS